MSICICDLCKIMLLFTNHLATCFVKMILWRVSIVERRRVKVIKTNISGKADRVKKMFVILFRELINIV